MKTFALRVSEVELDYILAALRLWQQPMAHIADTAGEIVAIAEEHGVLTDAAVDDLCQRINCDSEEVDLWELSVRALESEGLTRSDAQAVVDAEDARDTGEEKS